MIAYISKTQGKKDVYSKFIQIEDTEKEDFLDLIIAMVPYRSSYKSKKPFKALETKVDSIVDSTALTAKTDKGSWVKALRFEDVNKTLYHISLYQLNER